MAENLSIWVEGILAAVAVALCQLAVGRRLASGASLAGQWALGIAALGLLNALELSLGWGRLIPFNALAIFLLLSESPARLAADVREFFTGRFLALALIGGLLIVANALQPLWDWDAQDCYVRFARHWAERGAFDPEGLWHVYAHRPQLVSVVYAWALQWGNDTTCQTLDLLFFLAALGWLGQRIGLHNTRLALAALLAMGALLKLGEGGLTWSEPLLPSYPGRGGNDFLPLILLLGLVEFLARPPILGACLLGGALLVTRWSMIPCFVVFMLWAATPPAVRARHLLTLAGALALALPWYHACWQNTGNPFYPHEFASFMNHPSNALMEADFSSEGMRQRGVQGVDSLVSLRGFAQGTGLSFLLYLLALCLRIPSHLKSLVAAAMILGIGSLLTTSQVRFQFPTLIILAALVSGCAPRLGGRAGWLALLLALAVAGMPALGGRLRAAASLAADSRLGRNHLVEERVRLWPAARWLNALDEGEGPPPAVLWPMNPSYHCLLPSVRVDLAAYLMEPSDLEGPSSMTAALRRMGVRWIVAAPPYYQPTEQGALAMMDVVSRLRAQGGVRCIARLPKTGVSPVTEILELLPAR